MVMRANIVLFRGQGHSQQEVAVRLMVERVVVSKWENRFQREGFAGLEERRRSGRPPQVAAVRRTAQRHTHAEWLAFLKQIDSEAPEGLTLHMVIDNYSTHQHPRSKARSSGAISGMPELWRNYINLVRI